jgi:hypothetical protein
LNGAAILTDLYTNFGVNSLTLGKHTNDPLSHVDMFMAYVQPALPADGTISRDVAANKLRLGFNVRIPSFSKTLSEVSILNA